MTATSFLWDTSSHDDTPTSRDAIEAFGCKLTDGDHFYANPTFTAKMTAMRGFGVDTFFAYHVLWGNASIANQVAWFLQCLDARLPWWRDPGVTFFVMSDDEPFGYNQAPSIAQINAFHDALSTASGGRLPAAANTAYAPHWFYGDAVAGLRYKWWQSDYGTNPTGPYRSVYPGNTSPRWSGAHSVDLLQYGSNTIIAGQDTSDASAFRGTLDQLKAALGEVMTAPVPSEVEKDIYAVQAAIAAAANVATRRGSTLNLDLTPMWARIGAEAAAALKPQLDAIQAKLVELEDKIDALPGGGGGAPEAIAGSGTFTFSAAAAPPATP